MQTRKWLIASALALAGQTSQPANTGALFPPPVLPEQINSLISPPVSRNDDLSASQVSNLFLTSRSDMRNTLMDHIKSAASSARSTREAEQLMGFNSPIGLDASRDFTIGMDGLTGGGRQGVMNRVDTMDAQIPSELISPSGQHLSLTNFPQLLAQTGQSASSNIPSPGIANVPDGLAKISQEFGSTISSMSSHIGRLFGPSPAYNGPCQCRACMNVIHRLRIVLYENTYHYGVQEIDQELDDRFCYGERWMYRSTCYYLVGRYREMLKVLVWLGTKEFDVCSFLFQCYPTSHV